MTSARRRNHSAFVAVRLGCDELGSVLDRTGTPLVEGGQHSLVVLVHDLQLLLEAERSFASEGLSEARDPHVQEVVGGGQGGL